MEIITIPLSGELHHKDSMGNFGAIKREIQVMSAGTGIQHSEFNGSKEKPVTLLQIWVIPRENGVEPRYDQLKISDNAVDNEFQQIVSPNRMMKEFGFIKMLGFIWEVFLKKAIEHIN